MKIVIDANGTAVFFFTDESVRIDGDCLIVNRKRYAYGQFTIVDGAEPPLPIGGAYSYVNGVYTVVNQALIDEYLNVKRIEQKAKIKEAFVKASINQIVDTGLGFSVDGGRDNKDDFFSKWEAMVDLDTTTVRDAYNSFHHGVTKEQMQLIYRAIVGNGEALLGKKWTLEVQIDSAITLDEIEAVMW